MRRLAHYLFTLTSALSLLLCVMTMLVWGAHARSGRGQRFDVVALWPGEHRHISILADDASLVLQVRLSPDPARMTPAEQEAWRGRPRTYREWRRLGFLVGGGRWEDNTAGYDRQFDAGLPLLLAIPLLLVPPIAWTRREARARRVKRLGLCPGCGYDLRATPERCPECGASTSAAPV